MKTIKESNVSRGIWKLKEKYFRKQKSSFPVAKKNKEGQLITNEAELKKLYLDNFIHRMRDRPILPELQSYEKEVNEKFKNVLQQTSKEKSPPWNMTELDKVLRKLKLKQSQDLRGYSNILFHSKFIGTDLKQSLLIMFNKMKELQMIPKTLN